MLKFIIVLLIPISLHAINFYPVGKADANTTYSKKNDCETKEGQMCFDITGKTTDYLKVLNGALVEDETKKQEYMQKVETDKQVRLKHQAHLKDKFFGHYIKDKILKDIKSKDLSSSDAKEVLDLFADTFLFLEHGLLKHAKSKLTGLTLTANTISSDQRTEFVNELSSFLGI